MTYMVVSSGSELESRSSTSKSSIPSAFLPLSIGLVIKFLQVFPSHCTEKPKWTFWLTQYQKKILEIPLKGEKWSEIVTQSCLTLCDPMDCSLHTSLSMEFSRQEDWSGLPFPSPGGLADPGIEPESPASQAESLLSESPGNPTLRGKVGLMCTTGNKLTPDIWGLFDRHCYNSIMYSNLIPMAVYEVCSSILIYRYGNGAKKRWDNSPKIP